MYIPLPIEEENLIGVILYEGVMYQRTLCREIFRTE